MERRTLAPGQKKALKEGRTLLFVDESGFYLLPSVVRTYAPRGATPVLRHRLSREHLSVISAITPESKLFMMVQEKSYKGPDVVRFLAHLLRHISGKLLVVWDGAPIHRGRAVKDFLTTGRGKRIHLERLPAYAPELNPDEGIWNYLKRVEMRNMSCSTIQDLRAELRLAKERLRHKRRVIAGCFTQAGLV
ncbi:MAG: IS630 family transposase [Dehalococcoidia bacterium]